MSQTKKMEEDVKIDGYTKVKNLLITSSNLNNAEFRILVYLISISKKGFCYPSASTISENTGMTKRNVYRILSNLEKKEFILKENRTIGTGKKTSNRYLINEDAISKNIRKEINTETVPIEEVETDPLIDTLSDYDWLNG